MKKSGFTLIEMLVSVGLFAIVMLMVSSAYLIVIASDRQAQAVGNATNDLAFALDIMSRSIRTGTNYECNGSTNDCLATPGSTFSFTDAGGCSVSYTLLNNQILETVGSQPGCTALTNAPLTDSTVSVNSLNFYAQGMANTGAGDYRQPQVVITISGTVAAGPGKTVKFTIETGASMRVLDI